MSPLAQRLKDLDACAEGVAWARRLPEGTTPQQAWELCPKSPWLVWVAVVVGVDPKVVTLAVCEVVRVIVSVWEKHHPEETLPREALESVEAWARGTKGAEDVFPFRERLNTLLTTLQTDAQALFLHSEHEDEARGLLRGVSVGAAVEHLVTAVGEESPNSMAAELHDAVLASLWAGGAAEAPVVSEAVFAIVRKHLPRELVARARGLG